MDDPHAEMKIKPQLKHRDSMAKKEDPKSSHQLYKLQIKSTQSTRKTLCLWNIKKIIENSHQKNKQTKKHTLVLIAVDIGGKNTQE